MAGVVLAGGRSSRMGEDKALLRYKDKKLIDHMIGLLTEAGLKSTYISGDLPDYPCISDLVRHQGPLVGVRSVLQEIRPLGFSSALFVPVDMPLLKGEVFLSLRNHIDHCDAVCYQEHHLPVLLRLTEDVNQALMNHCADNNTTDRSLRHFLGSIDTHRLTIPDELQDCFENINTPTQWRRLKDHEATVIE